jgi:hypothetical protein
MRFEQFIERICEVLRAAGVRRKRDPRAFLYLSMVMLDFEDTLIATRRRDRIPMQALAWLARRMHSPAA